MPAMTTPEQRARLNIDRLLEAAGWVVQDRRDLNLGAGLGVAMREFQLSTGPADYLLFVQRKAIGVVDANPDGRWRAYPYEQLIARDKANLDIFWLRDESLEDSAALPDPDVLAAAIIEDLQAALAQFSLIVGV